MNLHFRLQGTLLEPQEAAALLTAANKGANTIPEIDLDKVINIDKLDSASLFKMSVETNNKDLASLAWKISVAQQDTTGKKPTFKKTPTRVKKYESTPQQTIEELIEHIASSTSYPCVGMAMLLQMTNENSSTTIRKTAVHYVNKIWEDGLLIKRPHNQGTSKFFRGFKPTGDGWVPLILQPGIVRKDTFHVSPIYIALREGLLLGVREGIFEQSSVISWGASQNKESNTKPGVSKMSRVFYNITKTNKGSEMYSKWGDIDEYIKKAFAYHVSP